MSRDETYPGANTHQWFGDDYPGDRFNANCGVLHTTESIGWPSYSGGATAPNLTARPDFRRKRLAWRQHHPIDRSSRALRNEAGGVETNTLNAAQVELVGTCDPAHRRRWGKYRAGRDYIYWPDAPKWALRDLGKFLAWCDREHGIKLAGPKGKTWRAYPGSYGYHAKQRFSNRQWLRHYGWCGHQHVPENTHGDPGALNFAAVLRYARTFAGRDGHTDRPDRDETRKQKVVTVWAGATLAAIAALAGVGVPALVDANPQIHNPNVIHPGDKVTLPPGAGDVHRPDGDEPDGQDTAKPDTHKPETRSLHRHDHGADVTAYERCLHDKALLPANRVGGHYTLATVAATNRLVAATRGRLGAADGVAGPLTQRAACHPWKPVQKFTYDEHGLGVLNYEACLDRRRDLMPRRWVDGYYGTVTAHATDRLVRRHQPRLGSADGTAGPMTQRTACR